MKKKKVRSLQAELFLRLTVGIVVIFVVLAGIILYGFRSSTLKVSQNKAILAAYMVRNALASAKQHDLVEERDEFLAPLLHTEGVDGLRVIRGERVDKEFGNNAPQKGPKDDLERAVLASGKPLGMLKENLDSVTYRMVVPFVAINQGGLDCTGCHDVKLGEVLGAISVTMDLSGDRKGTLWVFYIIGGVTLLLFGVVLFLLLLFMRSFFTRPIKGVIESIASSSSQFTQAAEQVAAASNGLAGATNTLVTNADSTMTALSEMAASTHQNEAKTREAFRFADEAEKTMAEAKDSAIHLTRKINDLSENTLKSAVIIRTIDEIAFQTNLLALNAAVEAARAGDTGAGFAVVAEEVRNLARRSADAAKQTAELLEASQTNAQSSVDAAAHVEKALTGVAETVIGIRSLMEEVAREGKNQSEGVTRASATISDMQGATEDTASTAEESAATAEELASQAVQLMEIVDDLRLMVGGNRANGGGSRTLADQLEFNARN